MASARNARLPSASATTSLRRASQYIAGIASAVTAKPGQENDAPVPIQSDHPADATT
jgi:hypothetical protein